MEYKYYVEFSKERRELRQLWNHLQKEGKAVDWEDFVFTAEKIKQANETE